jgi:Flp pilus assembly protein TadG
MMAVCVTVLFGFVALAIDLGMVIIARSAAQDAADTAALSGARVLDGRVPANTNPDDYDNRKDEANVIARASVKANSVINNNMLTTTSLNIGIYDYDTVAQTFRFVNGHAMIDPDNPPPPGQEPPAAVKPAGKSWTAVEVNVAAQQPAFFSGVFGISSLPASARAVAVHRPRDVALILDMSGSMKFASTYAWPPGTASSTGTVSGLLNPDPTYPRFGHYQRYPTTTLPNAFMRTTNFIAGTQEVFSPTNMTTDADVGPAIVRQFVFAYDVTNNATPASPVNTVSSAGVLRNAFHRWNPPGMNPTTTSGEFGPMSPPTGWSGYNAFDRSNTSGPTPAPASFATQEDDGAIKYVGDRSPRKAGRVLRDGTSWDPATATGAAKTAWDVLFPNTVAAAPTLSTSTLRTVQAVPRPIGPLGVLDARLRALSPLNVTAPREGGSTWQKFVDGAWEQAGYDLDLEAYNAQSGAATPGTYRPAVASRGLDASGTFPTNGRFHGYSMGPAYYGKTFFVWPPDPRWGNPNGGSPLGGGVRPDNVLAITNPTSTDTSLMVKDSSGNWICDWRRRFFLRNDSANTGTPSSDPVNTTQGGTWKYFHPEGDNDPVNAGTQNVNLALLRGTTGHTLRDTGYKINYRAVLAWIKSGPQVLPPNLRAGKVKYYASIPDNVDNAGSPGTNEQYLDQRFWREYIDYVMGYKGNHTNYDAQYMLAGVETAVWAGAAVSINATANETYTADLISYTNPKPYMNYTDIPNRPRLHFWFGPMSMLMFISGRYQDANLRNWNAGSLAEAQTWQLKAGVRSALDDIKNNHPNDLVGTTYFAGAAYQTIRAPLSQDWENLKNALYYPKSLLAGIRAGGAAANNELRPYNSSFGNALAGNGSSQDADLPNGNGGTDPVSGFATAFNLLSSAPSIPDLGGLGVAGAGTGRRGATKIVIFETDGVPNTWRNFNLTPAGANSYYTKTTTTGSGANGDANSINKAMDIVDQIVAPTTSNGYSLVNSPARVYPIAFGDLFSSTSTYKGQALTFLQDVAYHGLTGDSAAAPLPDYQIITGTASERIEKLRSSFERILQSGVQVTLIE